MDYNHINNFLDKFKNIFFKEEEVYKIIAMTITKHIASQINYQSIKIKGTSIYIKGSPVLKNEVLIHKEGILKDLSGLITDRKFYNIY